MAWRVWFLSQLKDMREINTIIVSTLPIFSFALYCFCMDASCIILWYHTWWICIFNGGCLYSRCGWMILFCLFKHCYNCPFDGQERCIVWWLGPWADPHFEYVFFEITASHFCAVHGVAFGDHYIQISKERIIFWFPYGPTRVTVLGQVGGEGWWSTWRELFFPQ